MPEGDTVHTLAAELGRRLTGRRLTAGRVATRPGLRLGGHAVKAVRARGKHLFVELAGTDGKGEHALVLRSHLGLHGSWHRYRPGERWQRPPRQASLVLETEDDVLVCFCAEEIELAADEARGLERRLRLGPDLVVELPDAGSVLARARHFLGPDAPLADVLLDQRVACGIGNVYKSELCFLAGLHPALPLARVDEARLAGLLARAHELLRANVQAGPRLWVYRRAGRPCLRCGSAIDFVRLGRGRRSTYWCPRCQPVP